MRNGKAQHVRSDPGPMPAPATFCKHCNASFLVSIPIIGQKPGSEFYQTTANLAQHIQQKHPEVLQVDATAQINMAFAYSSQRVLAHFTSTDHGLMLWLDCERHKILRSVCHAVPDERIEQKVAQLFEFAAQREEGPRTPTMEEVIQLVKSMRDALEERHLYPGTTLEPAPNLVSAV
jgi:hypothetical protein